METAHEKMHCEQTKINIIIIAIMIRHLTYFTGSVFLQVDMLNNCF